MSSPFTFHGGDLASARARFGGKAGDWIDLSTGINPSAWPGAGNAAIDWRALPDRAALADLEQRAARHFGVSPALCRAVPGSEAGLRLLAPLLDLPGRHRALSYRSHADAFEHAAPLSAQGDLPRSASTLVLANPNNPDGTVTAPGDILATLGHQEAHGGWLIVDEAFADCSPEISVAALVAEGRRLIVLRSFGKFFGLAGLRLGFVIAPQALLARLGQRMGDWPVNAAALALGAAAYADHAWIAATRAALPGRAAAVDGVLARHGLVAEGACPLFRLVRTPRARGLFAGLAQRHILTRPFAERAELLRLGLPGDAAALDRLDAALGAVLADG